MTFADFAITEARFRKHFRTAPQDTWSDAMVPLAEFLGLDGEAREGKFPFVWSVDRQGKLTRLLVDQSIVESAEDRRDFWRVLRALAGVGKAADQAATEQIEQRTRQEIVGRIMAGLMQLAGGPGAAPAPVAATQESAPSAPRQGGDYMAPWIDTENCTSCDECVNLNPKIFAYNDKKKAFVQDPDGGPYSDLVKAAEKCTAKVIHPGLPRDRGAKDIDKWTKRGEKFN
jgi:pyruvate-ferredoxin/flavodoxin oxidoreductase